MFLFGDLFGDYGNLDLSINLRPSNTASLKGIDVSNVLLISNSFHTLVKFACCSLLPSGSLLQTR